MKTKFILCLLSLASIIFISACRTERRYSSSASPSGKLNSMVRDNDSRISELTFQLKQLNESNNKSVKVINSLIQKNAKLTRDVANLEKNITVLKKALDMEINNRQKDNAQLLKEVAKQTAAAINAKNAALQRTQRQNSSSRTGNMPPTKGSFYLYTVQPGATLGAIAKAYKVSVADIKKANKLKSDFIRVGQKLYIPKK